MSTESAVAYVSVVPVARGARRAIEREINPQALGTSVGSRMSGSFLKSVGSMALTSTKIIGGAATAIGATIAGVAAKKGMDRLLNIDDAQGKLKGLGNSTKQIATIMDSALASVKGTAFGLGDAATVASNAVAAGIKPGQDLTKYLTLTADAASIAGVSLDEMGSIINKTTTAGKVYTDNLNQLADRGIPIFSWLQKEYGVSAEELSSMVSKGKVDAVTFRKVIEENIGGAAQASGKTVRGAYANMLAALGRIGAAFLSGGVAGAPALFTSITGAIDSAGKALQPFADTLNSKVTAGMTRLVGWIDKVDFGQLIAGFQAVTASSPLVVALKALAPLFPIVRDAAAQLAPVLGQIALVAGGALANMVIALTPAIMTLLPVVVDLVQQLGGVFLDALIRLSPALTSLAMIASELIIALVPIAGVLGDALVAALVAVLPLVTDLSYLLAPLTGFMAENTSATTTLAVAILGGVVAYKAYKAITGTIAGVQQILIARTYGVAGATYAQATAGRVAIGVNKALALSSKIAAAATLLFNGALRANPLGLIVTAIGAVVAGLVWFFTQTKLGQSIVQTVFAAIKVAVAAVGAAFTWLWQNAVKPAWDGIATGATWLWTTILQPAFAGIALAVQTVGGFFVSLWTNYIAPPLTAIGNAIGYLWNSWISPIFQLIGAIFVWAGGLIASTVSAITNVLVNTLGAAFTFLWVGIIQPVFTWIGALISVWWTTVSTIFGFVVSFVRNTLGAAFSWLWTGVISPVFTWIGSAVSAWWTGVVQPVFGAVVGFLRNTLGPVFTWLRDSIFRPVFNGIGTIVRGVWNSWIKPVFDKIVNIAKVTIPAAFTVMKDGIAKAWGFVKSAVKAPIKFIVETVIQKGIIGNFNKLADVFHTKPLPKVELPKGFATGGYTGPGGKYDPAGIVHKDEFVFTKEQTRRIGVGKLYDIARNGYAKGGLVTDAKKNISAGWDWVAGKAGKAWDWTKNAAETAASIVSDPTGTLGKLVKGLIGKVPGAGAMLDMAKGIGGKVLSGVIEKIKGIGSDAGAFGGNGANGQLPSSALAKASGFAPGSGVAATGGLLQKGAAAAWNLANKASGGILRLTEGYRDLKAQAYRWSIFQNGGNLAAPIGTSVHGLGRAADVAGGQDWLRAHGAKYGWANTGLGFSQREPWHFEFKGMSQLVPQLAGGAYISRSMGGSLVNVGEGRYDEAVVPLTPGIKENLLGGRRQGQRDAPLIEGLTLVSSGSVKHDLDEVDHWLSSLDRGGRHK